MITILTLAVINRNINDTQTGN